MQSAYLIFDLAKVLNDLCLMFCLYLALLLHGPTYAHGADSLASQRFQLQDEVTVLSAMKDYNDTVLQLKRLSATEQAKECSFAELKIYRCTRESPSGFFYLPPFPVALPYNVPKNPSYVPSFSWAPVKEALEGAKVVAQWKDSAKAGTLFDCNGPTCWTIVHGFSRSEKSEEDTLALP